MEMSKKRKGWERRRFLFYKSTGKYIFLGFAEWTISLQSLPKELIITLARRIAASRMQTGDPRRRIPLDDITGVTLFYAIIIIPIAGS